MTEHAPSLPDFIKAVCKDWCCLDNCGHRDNLVCETLLPSSEEGETLKDSTTIDLRRLI